MSKRLQVVLDDAEYRDLRKIAKGQHMTVSEWVRQALREVRRRTPEGDAGRKLLAVREAARYSFPASEPDQMLREIEAGYLSNDT